VCFAKHTLNKHNLGQLGLNPDPAHSFFFFMGLGLAQPIGLGLKLQRRVRRGGLIGLGTLADQNQYVPTCVELST
jgi:hypothetical protein